MVDASVIEIAARKATNHQRIQVPNLGVLYLIMLFEGVGVPIHRPYILFI